jgi:hypothetical protein
MSPQPPPIDIVTVFIAIAGVLFGPDLAAVIGPYAVILLGAALGAGWSATRREPGTRGGTLLHMLLMMGWALIVTVPAAIVAGLLFGLEAKWLLGPVAVVIAGIGPDWPEVGRWGLGLLKGLAERWAGKGERQ